jgi:hypothetical protein
MFRFSRIVSVLAKHVEDDVALNDRWPSEQVSGPCKYRWMFETSLGVAESDFPREQSYFRRNGTGSIIT